MRTVLVALACAGLLGSTASVASAEASVLPELPDAPGVVFTDDPAILAAGPIPAGSYSRTADDRAVAVHFTTGTPECYGVHATVQETPDDVTVELQGGTRPAAADRACIMIAVSGTLMVPLAGPLGDRQVLSAH